MALIVEYNPWLRLMLANLFDKSGFEVRCASNGAAGLRLAMRLGPELVIVGDSLPELSAEHLIAELEGGHGVWATRVVLVRDLMQRETYQPGHTSGPSHPKSIATPIGASARRVSCTRVTHEFSHMNSGWPPSRDDGRQS
ncbi:MAG TPA: response regulator [Chloroflexota bacterium]